MGRGSTRTDMEFRNINALYPLRDLYEIFSVCGQFFHKLSTEIWGIRFRGSGVVRRFNIGVEFSTHFQRPSAETIRRMRKSFGGASTVPRLRDQQLTSIVALLCGVYY